MSERVKALIDRLYLTYDPFEQGCLDCGFSPEDLTSAEMDDFYGSIFQCQRCGYWCESYNSVLDISYGQICNECADEMPL